MLKTIKTTKQMRLDELIKYVWDNGIKSKQELITYKSNLNTVVTIDLSGQIAIYGAHFGNEIFTVEVEELITEDTVFDTLVDVNNNDEVQAIRNASISLYIKEQTKEIHALINGRLELVWERDEDE